MQLLLFPFSVGFKLLNLNAETKGLWAEGSNLFGRRLYYPLIVGLFTYFYKDLTTSHGQLEFKNTVSFVHGMGFCERKRCKDHWDREAWQSISQTFPILCIQEQAGKRYGIFKATEKASLRIGFGFFLAKVIQDVRDIWYSLCWSKRRKVC